MATASGNKRSRKLRGLHGSPSVRQWRSACGASRSLRQWDCSAACPSALVAKRNPFRSISADAALRTVTNADRGAATDAADADADAERESETEVEAEEAGA